MKILLDTCSFLWLASDSPRLTAKIKSVFEDRTHIFYFSVGSAWEIAIKHKLGQINLPETPERYIQTRITTYDLQLMNVSLAHAIRAGSLPIHHKDPFDRMIIAQAQVEGLMVATPDKAFVPYSVEIFW